MLFVLVLVTFVFVTAPASVIFEDCGSAYHLTAVYINGCSWSLPCYVTLGEEMPVSMEFFAGFASSKLDQDVLFNINLINLSTDVTPDQCEATTDCPVQTNARTSFTSVMTVPTRMALNSRGYLRWRVYNEQGRLVLCYSVLVQTQSIVQKLLRQALADTATEDINSIVDNIDLQTFHNIEVPTNYNFTKGYLQGLLHQYYSRQKNSTDLLTNLN